MRRTIIMGLALLLAGAASATASGVIDQQQTSIGPGVIGASCPLGYDAGRHAQGVTPSASSWSEVSLLLTPLTGRSGAPLLLNVREPATDGSPTGAILASTTAALPVGLRTWTDFVFAPPVSLTPGAPVFLELELRDSVVWHLGTADPYAGGQAWVHCGGAFDEFPLTRVPDWDFAFITRTLVADSDGDGIPDEADPDTAAAIVNGLEAGAFNGPGNQTALLSRLANAEELIQSWYDTGDTAARDDAVSQLRNLLRRVDGCGVSADSNDWITDCTAQVEVRDAIQTIIHTLTTG